MLLRPRRPSGVVSSVLFWTVLTSEKDFHISACNNTAVPYYRSVSNEADITQTNIMELNICIGKNSNYPVATCKKSDLLDTLRDTEVRDAIMQSLCIVRVLSEDGEELASQWYDAATEHEEGQDWDTLSESLAAKIA